MGYRTPPRGDTHHVKEEQDTMFPKARKAGIDLIALGTQMLERKEALRDE